MHTVTKYLPGTNYKKTDSILNEMKLEMSVFLRCVLLSLYHSQEQNAWRGKSQN